MKSKSITSFILVIPILALALCACTSTVDPVTDAPVTDAPVTDAPATDAPATDAPAVPELDALDSLTPSDGEKLRIACIGDSITQGTGVDDKENDSYPAQLQKLLGEDYVVGNFGKGSSYVLKADSKFNTSYKDRPQLSYKNTAQYSESLAFEPDVVVIMLGTNDMRHMVSDAAKAEFKDTLAELVKSYAELSSVQRVYLCTNIHALSSSMAEQLSSGEMGRLVKETSEAAGCGFIDVNSITFDFMSVYMNTTADRLHPGKEGYAEIARVVEAGIRGTEAEISVPAVSDSGVVFVSASGKADGKGETPESAVNDLAKAVGLLRESGGTIVICGPVNVDYHMFLPDTAKHITVTSVHNGVDYRTTAGAKINMSRSLFLGGDFTFDETELHMTANSVMFVCNYHNVTIGDGVKCTLKGGVTAYPVFVVGVNVGNAGVPDSEIDFGGKCEIVINSGDWQYIRGGNRRSSQDLPVGRILEGASVTVTVNGGTFRNGGTYAPNAAVGMNSVYGTCSLIINGGTFNSDIAAVGRVGGITGPFSTEMKGTVNLEINGGTISGKIIAVFDSTSNVTGKVNVTCAAAYESKLHGNFSSKVIK